MAMRADDAPVLSSDVHQISPMSNPKPVHATCRYAFTLSGSIFSSGRGDLSTDFGLSRKNLLYVVYCLLLWSTVRLKGPPPKRRFGCEHVLPVPSAGEFSTKERNETYLSRICTLGGIRTTDAGGGRTSIFDRRI
jgi:hypothetical protein